MLMTINRSIDYTKASKGLKLVPRQETINLLEALALPLMCMKDIQTRIPVTLEPLDKRICSFIITDKQWLQENLLCLLSNAVKYSNDGSVAVRALCVSVQTHRAMIDERNSTAAYTTGTQSHIVHMMNHVNLQEEQEQEEKRAGSSNEPSSYLRIEVEDHGIGLSNEAMVTLFSPFKQAQRLAGGTGLGLFSLAKRIEALEGLCGVQHRRDGEEGSLFWFQIPYRPDPVMSRSEGPNTFGSSSQPSQRPLPLLQASSFTWVPGSSTPAAGRHMADNTVPTTHITSSEAGAHGDLLKPPTSPPTLPSDAVVATNNAIAPAYTLIGAGLEVLVVDDAPAIVKMTTMMLRKHKHNVATATNGAEAVKLVCDRVRKLKKSFDVVLMDLQMPVMDGLEATRRLRSMEAAGYWASVVQVEEENSDVESVQQRGRVEGIHALIIGVSANSDSETMQEAYRAGVDDFIAKPFTMDTFYRVFQRSQSVLPTAEGMAESRCISRGDVALSMVSHD